MIPEHERAVLVVDLPEYGLQAGDMGTIVHVYKDGVAYEVEIFSADGHTLDVVTVEASQVRPVNRRDVLHVREIAS
jgi:hypothetical protein